MRALRVRRDKSNTVGVASRSARRLRDGAGCVIAAARRDGARRQRRPVRCMVQVQAVALPGAPPGEGAGRGAARRAAGTGAGRGAARCAAGAGAGRGAARCAAGAGAGRSVYTIRQRCQDRRPARCWCWRWAASAARCAAWCRCRPWRCPVCCRCRRRPWRRWIGAKGGEQKKRFKLCAVFRDVCAVSAKKVCERCEVWHICTKSRCLSYACAPPIVPQAGFVGPEQKTGFPGRLTACRGRCYSVAVGRASRPASRKQQRRPAQKARNPHE